MKPPPFIRQSFKAEELTDVTPESRAYCSKLIEGAVFGTLFTPIGLKADRAVSRNQRRRELGRRIVRSRDSDAYM